MRFPDFVALLICPCSWPDLKEQYVITASLNNLKKPVKYSGKKL